MTQNFGTVQHFCCTDLWVYGIFPPNRRIWWEMAGVAYTYTYTYTYIHICIYIYSIGFSGTPFYTTPHPKRSPKSVLIKAYLDLILEYVGGWYRRGILEAYLFKPIFHAACMFRISRHVRCGLKDTRNNYQYTMWKKPCLDIPKLT